MRVLSHFGAPSGRESRSTRTILDEDDATSSLAGASGGGGLVGVLGVHPAWVRAKKVKDR